MSYSFRTIAPLARRAFEVLRNDGVRVLVIKVIGELLYRRIWILETDLWSITSAKSLPDEVELRWLTEDTVDDYTTLVPWGDAAVARERLRSGQSCLVAYAEGRAVHSRQMSQSRAVIDYVGVEIELAPRAAYLYEVYSSPSFQRRGLASATWGLVPTLLSPRGVTRVCGSVMPENRSGVRYVETLGYRRVAEVRTLRTLGWRWSWLKSMTPNPPLHVVDTKS